MSFKVILPEDARGRIPASLSEAAKLELNAMFASLEVDPIKNSRVPPCPPYVPHGRMATRRIPGERTGAWEVFFEVDMSRRQVGVTEIVYRSARSSPMAVGSGTIEAIDDGSGVIEIPVREGDDGSAS